MYIMTDIFTSIVSTFDNIFNYLGTLDIHFNVLLYCGILFVISTIGRFLLKPIFGSSSGSDSVRKGRRK